MMNDTTNIINDQNPNKESESIKTNYFLNSHSVGAILLCIGISMGIILFFYDLYSPTDHFSTAFSVMQTFIIGGGTLSGIKSAESIFGKK